MFKHFWSCAKQLSNEAKRREPEGPFLTQIRWNFKRKRKMNTSPKITILEILVYKIKPDVIKI